MTDEVKGKQIGPQATTNRNRLPSKELKQLFDWLTVKLHEDAVLYSSILQGSACFFPNATFWTLVKMTKIADENLDLKKNKGRFVAQADANLRKKPS